MSLKNNARYRLRRSTNGAPAPYAGDFCFGKSHQNHFAPGLCAGKPSRFPRSTLVSEGSPTGHPCPDVERAASCLRPFGLGLRLRDSLGLSRGAKKAKPLPIYWGGDLKGGRKLEQRTTPWMEEVEPRLEQRSRSGCRVRVAPATDRAGIVPNNPPAFPPSLAVRCRKLEQRTTPWQGLFPTIPLHFRPPWRSDGGRLQGCRR